MTLIGVLLLLIPFLFILFYEDKIKSFFYILSAWFTVHLLIAFITQYFGIFSYINVICVYIFILCIAIIAVLFTKRKIHRLGLNPFFLVVFALIFIQLWSVHYHYTGSVQTILGFIEVKNDSYLYPIFSDEWVGASLSKYSIETGKLPLVNPFVEDKPFFPNLLFPFHTLLASLFLILGVGPVLNFAVMPIALGFLICIVAYFTLRTLGVGYNSSLLAVLFLPLVTQSGNLTGIWFAIPYLLSFLLYLVFISGIFYKDKYLYILSSLMSFIFYPPMIVIIAPVYAFYFIKNIYKWLIFLLLSLLPVMFYPELLSKVFRPNLDGGIINFPIFKIIPIIILPFILLGIQKLYKDKHYFLLAPLFVGLSYWIFYAFYPNVLIIEYPRIVMITSLLLVIISGFGFNILESFISNIYSKIIILLIFAIVTWYYPIGDNWKEFTLIPFAEEVTLPITPASPINRHLLDEEILMFADIKNKVFISPPWKGLVLGSFTNNYPLETKSSTITTDILNYKEFIRATCDEKFNYIKEYDISYVYSATLTCDYLKKVSQSSEKLTLYEVQIN
jgi:hypothetical protein